MQLDTILDYTYDVNYSVQKGECLKLGMCLPLSYCTEYEDHIGASNTIPFEMGSVDIDGEGRIYHTSTSGFKYDCYLKDHLGSTRMVVNDENVVTEAFAYQPYGTIIPLADIAATPQTPTRQQFTGKEFDEEGSVEGVTDGIAAYYFGARFYDPEVGVWMSTDPKNQFFNPFAYSSNPINTVDPDGQWALALVAAAQWYISGVMSHGEINPGKWDWSDPGLWISTATAAFTIGMDLGNDIATILANRSKIINDYSAFGTDGGYAKVIFESEADQQIWNDAYKVALEKAPEVAKQMKALMDAPELYYFKKVSDLHEVLSNMYQVFEVDHSPSITGRYLGNEGVKSGGYILTQGGEARIVAHEAHHAYRHHLGTTRYGSDLLPVGMTIEEEVAAFDITAKLSGSQGRNWLGLTYQEKVSRLRMNPFYKNLP